MKINYILLAIFGILQIADVVTTIKVLQRPDRKEDTKFMAWLMAKIGIIPALAVTKVLILAIFGVAAWSYPAGGHWGYILSAVLIGWSGFYVWVVRNNKQLL